MLDPSTVPEAIQRLHDALRRYGSENPTWWTAQVAILLVLLGGLDDSSVAPVIEQIDSPVLSAKFTFARAVPFYMDGELPPPPNSPAKPRLRARAAGATHELAATLMGARRLASARLADATTADVFAPLAESLELWDRLRIPWGVSPSSKRSPRPSPSAATTKRHSSCGPPSTCQAFKPPQRSAVTAAPTDTSPPSLRNALNPGPNGAAMTFDQAIAYARRVIVPLTRATPPPLATGVDLHQQPQAKPVRAGRSAVRTFLMTDMVGSTKATREDPEAMQAFMDRHDELLLRAIAESEGRTFKHMGDGVCAVFDIPSDALVAAVNAQRALLGLGAGIRMGIDAGVAHERGDDYFGLALNRCSRVMGLAHGGQILVTLPVEELLRHTMPPGLTLCDLGELQLRDFEKADRLFQIVAADLPHEFPALPWSNDIN